MRLIYLTPGTGSYYCGTCMRDNTLVTALRRLGHDATLVPLYMPLMTDEPDASEGTPIFMGGVNVYLQQKSSLFRKTPRWLDQMFDSPKLLAMAASRAGTTSPVEMAEVTVSMLRGEEGHQNKEIERLVQWLKENQKPDAICLSNALLIGVARRFKAELDVPIYCCLQGEDSFIDDLPEPHKTQAWQIMSERCGECDAIIAISYYYRELMARRMNLPLEKFHVIHNGIALNGYGPAPNPPTNPTLGFFARTCRAKGLHTVVEAFILLKQRNTIPHLKLRVAGTRAAGDEAFVEEMKNKIAAAGFASDAEFGPPLTREQKIEFLQTLSVLSVPAIYGEAFGLYVIESLACGVPVVQPRSGAFPELIEATQGGVLCEPDNAQSLADEVEKLLTNVEAAREMGERGRQSVRRDFSADTMARNVVKVLCPV